MPEKSGRAIAQVADDPGIGLSSLSRWKRIYRETDLLAGPHDDVTRELALVRKENEHLRQEDMVLRAHIRSQFSTSNETYGAPRMHVELEEDGLDIGRHRVARLMRDNGLRALQKRRYKKTIDSCHGGPVAANLLDQDFVCEGPDQKWGAEIRR